MLMGLCTGNQKKQIAQDEFCNHLKAFVHALENLDEIAGHINSTADQIDGLLTTVCTVK
jgi:hypothetical protein